MNALQNLNKATTSNYELIFPIIPVVDKPKDMDIFTLNIHDTIIPSMTLGTIDVPFANASSPIGIAPTTFDPWYTNFSVDSNFCNWFILYSWIKYINDPIRGRERSQKNYKVDAILKLINNDNVEVMNLKIYGIYPSLLNEVTLSHRDGENVLECGVNFNYNYFEAIRL